MPDSEGTWEQDNTADASSAGGNAGCLAAAANGSTENVSILQTFDTSDMENFYRFI